MVRTTYSPALHLAFAAAWLLSIDAAFSMVGGDHGPWIVHPSLWAGVIVFFVILFYLRVLDEWKDFDYDKIYNPKRPLVTGAVAFNDLYWFLMGSAVLAVSVNFLVPSYSGGSAISSAILVADLLYGLALVGIEKAFPFVRDNSLVNLLLTYPVNILISLYAYSAYLHRVGDAASFKGVLVIAAFASAFLHYEFARKIAWPDQAPSGKRLYSTSLGVWPAVSLSTLFGFGAVGVAGVLFHHSGPLLFSLQVLALLLIAAGIVSLIRARPLSHHSNSQAPMKIFSMVFLVVFYAEIIGAAVIPGGLPASR